jgi:hypothetical protein
MALKPGSVNDMAASMAQRIADYMESEWQTAHDGDKLPSQGKLDRDVLFVAVANGVLHYLYEHLDSLQTTVVKDTADGHHHQLTFDLE